MSIYLKNGKIKNIMVELKEKKEETDMKKILCVIFSALMIFGSVLAAAAKKEEKLKITVTTDTHLQAVESNPLPAMTEETTEFTEGMIDRELYYYAAQQGQMNYESKAIIKSMLKDFENSDSRCLLIAGDLTNGKRNSHLEMAQLLKETEENCGKKIFVIVGNHDCAKESSEEKIDLAEFKRIYADFGFTDALEVREESASYTADLDDEYRLIAIDSCVYGEDDGEIDDAELEWIENQAVKAKADGKKIIAMMHHSILPHFYVQPMIDGYAGLAEKFSDCGINFVLTGHIHANDISSAKTKNGRTLYDVQTGSLITSPNAYREIEMSGEKFDITAKYVTEVDTADLPEGYNDSQKERISSDFSGYAKDIFASGICRWLNRYIGSAGKLGKTLKLEKGSFGYNLLDGILKNVGNALNTPIYDDGQTPDKLDSIEEIARAGGAELPQSGYEMPYQLAAKVYSAFYAGDEEKQLANGETELLFLCLKAVILQALNDLAFKDINAFAESIGLNTKDIAVSFKAKIYYSDLLAAKLAEALIVSLTAGLTSDLSDPADLNVTINLAESVPVLIPLSFFEKILYFFKAFIAAFKNL